MTIEQKKDGSRLTVALGGHLDTNTAGQLESTLRSAVDGVTEMIFDFKKLEYISSAGLRVLLSTQKTMSRQGKMVIRNVTPEIMEIFEVTGFTDIFDIER